MSAGDPGLVLLIGAVVVLVAVVAARITHQVGLPALLFLGLGLALGEAGLGIRTPAARRQQGRQAGRLAWRARLVTGSVSRAGPEQRPGRDQQQESAG